MKDIKMYTKRGTYFWYSPI